MSREPQIDLVFAHNLARYVAIGVDPNDAQRLIALNPSAPIAENPLLRWCPQSTSAPTSLLSVSPKSCTTICDNRPVKCSALREAFREKSIECAFAGLRSQ